MKTIQTRFGAIEFDPANVIHFPEGLVGLKELKNFLVIPNKKEGPLFWIQSVDDPAFACPVTDPTNFFLDYAIVPDKAEREKLKIKENDKYFILSITCHRINIFKVLDTLKFLHDKSYLDFGQFEDLFINS